MENKDLGTTVMTESRPPCVNTQGQSVKGVVPL